MCQIHRPRGYLPFWFHSSYLNVFNTTTGEQYLLIPAAILQAGSYNLTLQTPSLQIGPAFFTMDIQTPPQTLLLSSGQHHVMQDITALCCVYKGTAYSITTPGSLCQRCAGRCIGELVCMSLSCVLCTLKRCI